MLLMLYHGQKAFLLHVFLASCPIVSTAVDISQCLADVISCAQNASDQTCSSSLNISSMTVLSILRTNTGTVISSPDTATSLSYTGCTTYCGSGQEPFSWTVFAQEYCAFLLPYLALLSQLPFGARRRADNFMSAILTLGSPTLAGYSLYMTLLSARWVNDKLFSGIDYPNTAVRQSVVRVLSDLQQIPLRVHPGQSAQFESLVVHPDNDDWWITLAEGLNYAHTWSISSATSIAWVVIAYLLTVADSISNVSGNIQSNGNGTSSGWLWLLPIVVGWLVLSPKCDYDRVHDAYHRANKRVFVADSSDPTAAPSNVTSESDFGLTITPTPEWELDGRNVISPDERRIPPIFNYARIYFWYQNVYLTSLFYRTAWRNLSQEVGVDGNHISRNAYNDVPRSSRLGTRDQINRYCQPNICESHTAKLTWPRGLISNMIIASLMSLQLQWGTTGAAVLALWFTPTIGLGCRSLAYLLYGSLSTAVWMLLVSSSALAYYGHHTADEMTAFDMEIAERHPTGDATPNPCKPISATSLTEDDSREERFAIPLYEIHAPGSNAGWNVIPSGTAKSATRANTSTAMKYSLAARTQVRTILRVADWLRWTGKSLAIINATSTIANSIFQYAGVYTTCFCDSSVFYFGVSAAFNNINPTSGDVDLAQKAWIGGLALALTSCSFFVGSIYLLRDTLP